MACNSNAVSVLQELSVQRRWNPPIYEVTRSDGPPNDPTFEVTVTINEVTAVGVGRQKKAAKHDAAKKALELIRLPALTDGKAQEESQAPVNPHEEVTASNPIGELCELCLTKRLPEPKYLVIGDEGEPHAKTFTVRCLVSKRSEIGVAKKKQQAKHLAAQNMLRYLKANLKEFLAEIPDDPNVVLYAQKGKEVTEEQKKVDAEVLEKFKSIKDDIPVPILSPGVPFNEYHLAYKDQLEGLHHILKSEEVKMMSSSLQKVNIVAKHLNRTISITDTKGKDDQHIVFMLLDTSPTTVQAGQGTCLEVAQEQAAESVLQFLDLMSQ